MESRAAIFCRAMLRDREREAQRSLGAEGFQGPLRGEFVDGDRFFKLTAPLIYQSSKGWLTRDGGAVQLFVVKEGEVCDLESFPKWAMPFTTSAKCGVFHDDLYKSGLLYRDEADGVYFESLGFQGVADWRRYARWMGVRVGGWYAWHGYRANERGFSGADA